MFYVKRGGNSCGGTQRSCPWTMCIGQVTVPRSWLSCCTFTYLHTNLLQDLVTPIKHTIVAINMQLFVRTLEWIVKGTQGSVHMNWKNNYCIIISFLSFMSKTILDTLLDVNRYFLVYIYIGTSR